ncbi:unnamed protein product, partial [Sphacelaria rigidula]
TAVVGWGGCVVPSEVRTMSAAKLLPSHHEKFRSKEYWDEFFQKRTEAFEWYGEYDDLRQLVHRTLKRTDRILVVGCGNSNFSAELYDDGFEEVHMYLAG